MNHDHSNQSHSWTGCSFTPNLSVIGGVAFGIIATFSAYKLIDAIGETFKPPPNPVAHEVI